MTTRAARRTRVNGGIETRRFMVCEWLFAMVTISTCVAMSKTLSASIEARTWLQTWLYRDGREYNVTSSSPKVSKV